MSLFKRVLLALSFLFVTINANAQLSALDGNWYSKQWKYGYVLKNGIGTATSTNSPNFQVGQNIIQLTATSNTTFTGRQVYTDGKFYNVNARLQSDGRLYFEGEKNAKWVMERVGTPPVSSVPSSPPALHYIGATQSGDFFVDQASINKNGAWVSYTYVTDFVPNINFQGQDVFSSVALNKINCSTKQLVMGNYNLYSQKKGMGKLIKSVQPGINGPAIPIQEIDDPNSLNAAVFNYVCQTTTPPQSPFARSQPPQAPAAKNQQPNNPQPNNSQASIAQKLQMAADAIGGPPGWGTCMAAHIALDISASQPGALLPRLAEANQSLGIILGEIRQMYLRKGIPDATLGQHLKANTGRFRTGDEALDMVVKCNNKISEVVG